MKGSHELADRTTIINNSTADSTLRIRSFTPDGFRVGTAMQINGNNVVYHFIALRNPI